MRKSPLEAVALASESLSTIWTLTKMKREEDSFTSKYVLEVGYEKNYPKTAFYVFDAGLVGAPNSCFIERREYNCLLRQPVWAC